MDNKNSNLYAQCVCCGAQIPLENDPMLCADCANKIKSLPEDAFVFGTEAYSTKRKSRLFKREFSRTKKAITRAACSGKRYVRLYVHENVVEEVIDRLVIDGFKAMQSGTYYDSPLFVMW